MGNMLRVGDIIKIKRGKNDYYYVAKKEVMLSDDVKIIGNINENPELRESLRML